MVNNVLMLEGVEKTVYTAPFHRMIDPYTVRSRRIVDFGRKLAAFDGTVARDNGCMTAVTKGSSYA